MQRLTQEWNELTPDMRMVKCLSHLCSYIVKLSPIYSIVCVSMLKLPPALFAWRATNIQAFICDLSQVKYRFYVHEIPPSLWNNTGYNVYTER